MTTSAANVPQKQVSKEGVGFTTCAWQRSNSGKKLLF